MRPEHYILKGKIAVPCSVTVWGEWFHNAREERRVARYQFNDIVVSTVFIGSDHNFSSVGPPLIFETMIFGGKYNDNTYRCSTWEEAEEQHRRAVMIVKGEILCGYLGSELVKKNKKNIRT